MGRAKDLRDNKEVKTRPLKQEIENLKIDYMELEEITEKLYNNVIQLTQLLEKTIPFTDGVLKTDSENIVRVIKKHFSKETK